MKNRNNFGKIGLLLASVIGCLSFMGCVKTEELLSNTLTEDRIRYEIQQDIIFSLSVPDEKDDYRYQYTDDEIVLTDKNDEGSIVYREGKTVENITNYKNPAVDIKSYLLFGETKGRLEKKDGNWYYTQDDTITAFDKDGYRTLFENSKAKKTTVGDNVYYMLQIQTPLSELPYFCTNDFLKQYAEAFTLQINHYYEKDSKKLVCIKAFYIPDTEKLLSLYENDFGYEVTAFRLEKAELLITPSMSEISLTEQIQAEDMGTLHKEDDFYTISDIKEKINDENRLGYYLEDGTFTFSKPETGKMNWEYKNGDYLLGTYDKESNTYTDAATGEVTTDYYYQGEPVETEEDVTVIDSNDDLLLFEGSGVEEKTLYEVWNETFGMVKKPTKEMLVGFDAKEEFYNSDFANNLEDYFYNKSIQDLLGMTSKWNSLNTDSQYAIYHLIENYNIGLYTDDAGNIVSFQDAVILSGVAEQVLNEIKVPYRKYLTEHASGSNTVVYDEEGNIINEY